MWLMGYIESRRHAIIVVGVVVVIAVVVDIAEVRGAQQGRKRSTTIRLKRHLTYDIINVRAYSPRTISPFV